MPPLAAVAAASAVSSCQGVETPVEYEGGGMTFTQSCIVIEELAKIDPAISGQNLRAWTSGSRGALCHCAIR